MIKNLYEYTGFCIAPMSTIASTFPQGEVNRHLDIIETTLKRVLVELKNKDEIIESLKKELEEYRRAK